MTRWSTQNLQFTGPPERQVRGQSAVAHWVARWLQVPGCFLETKKENTIRLGKHQWPVAMTHTDWQMSCNITRPDLKVWLMRRRALPVGWSWVWATAASAVEQKPHEGSVSQHKNKHHSDSTVIKQDDLCVLFGSVTVETAEEQDHWKAAHSFNL